MMLNYFMDWAGVKCEELARNGFNASLVGCEETSNTAAVVDIEGGGVIARITAWDSGDVHLEVLNIEMETDVYSESMQLLPPFLFDERFADFFAALGSGRRR